jgi:phosphomannomutase
MLKESISGVRGIVGEGLVPAVIERYCAVFCAILPRGKIVVARDTRPTGKAISALVCATLNLMGRDAIDIGIQATPTAEVAVKKMNAAGGIIVTASHNPAEWNALKFLKRDGIFLERADFLTLRESLDKEPVWAKHDAIGKTRIYRKAELDHIEAIKAVKWLSFDRIRKAHLNVVLDANGGTGAIALVPLLKMLGCEVKKIGCKPDGNFAHNPEPKPENLFKLAETVRKNGADIGFATDPDADRLALVAGNGVAISEEYTLALGVAEAIEHKPGPIVVNLSTSAMVESLGQKVFRTAVGEINVTAKMLEINSPAGGEGNGGLIIPECHPGRDGALAAIVILHRLARTGKKLSQLMKDFPPLFMLKTKLNTSLNPGDKINELKKILRPISTDLTDGLRFITKEGWVHVRASNTEPVVRIIAEGKTELAAELLVSRVREVLISSR